MPTFTGTEGADYYLATDSQNYLIEGFGGNDTIIGAGGNDTIDGGSGADWITGGLGHDVLTGGSGADIFTDTAAGLNGDEITDFQPGDRIQISDLSADAANVSISGNTLFYGNGDSLTIDNLGPGRLVVRPIPNNGVEIRLQQDAHNDFNGDGRSDVLFRNDNGAIFDFLGQTNGAFSNNGDNIYTVVDNGWHYAGSGDFNGDGRSDILWSNDAGQIFDFLGTANGGVQNNGDNSWMQLPTGWTIAGTGDLNGDGRTDILLRNTDGTITDYLANANGGFTDNSSNLFTTVDNSWHVAGVADFNGDGIDDIMWRNDNGAIFDFLGTPNGGVVNNGDNIYTVVDNSWHFAGTGDFNGDGISDILWRNDNGAIFDFLGTPNGGVQNNGDNSWTAVSTDMHIAAVGDFNGDGIDDILWRSGDGTLTDWLGTPTGGFVPDGNTSVPVGLDWHVQDTTVWSGPGTFDF